MVIDIHGHITAPPEAYAFKASLIASRGQPMYAPPKISDDKVREYADPHVEVLRKSGTDIQLLSSRPFQAMHSMQPFSIVKQWTRFVNDLIAATCRLYPGFFYGVAGLPQSPNGDLAPSIEELERCVKELGFVGCLINPDPSEGGQPEPHGMGTEYWYPLYKKMVELDVPAMVHTAGCLSDREPYSLHFISEESIAIYSLLESNVFKEFPKLKIVVPHAGGAMPYQMARFDATRLRHTGKEPYRDSMRRLWYDTCNYSGPALSLLFEMVGADRCLFGTEAPGTGSAIDPKTGRMMDDLKPVIEGLRGLSEADRKLIFEDNARQLYDLKPKSSK